MKPIVYVAGPYRKPDPVQNTRRAVEVGTQLREDIGVVDLVPHLSLLEDAMFPKPPEYWLAVTMDRLRVCDAVFRIPGESQGSDAEEAEAIRLGIPVFYQRDALAEWVKEWKGQYASDRVGSPVAGVFTDRDIPDGVG